MFNKYSVIASRLIKCESSLSNANYPVCYKRLPREFQSFNRTVLDGFGGVPPIRPLETLHNALSLKQLDGFLEKMITVNLFKTPASSPPTPIQTPQILPDKIGTLASKLEADVL